MKSAVRILLLAAFLLSACAPASTVTPSPEPSPTSAPISIEPVPVDLPVVIAQSPMEGERLLLDTPIAMTFDRDMDKAATESAFAFLDADGNPVEGDISWTDVRTLRFTPDGKLAPASPYVAVISTSALSADGKSPYDEIRIEFKTVESLTVGQVFPADGSTEIDLDSTITVIFNRPIVPVMIAEDQGDLPQPITITPELAGTGEWVSSSVYVFQPEKLLASGTSYEVRVDAALKDTLGMSLGESFMWTFATRAPGIGTLSLRGGETNPKMDIENVLLDQAFVITFLQPMDKKSTEKAFSLVDRETSAVFPTRFKWNMDLTALTIEPVGRYRISGYYQLDLTTDALAQDGSPLNKGLSFRFSTLPLPRIIKVTPAPNSTADRYDPWITIQFSSPMNFDTIKSRVKVSPEPKQELRFYYNAYNRELNVIGLEPSTEYIVRILPGMQDIYGNAIQTETSFDFKTGKMYPAANLMIPQTLIYRVGGAQTIFFQYTNLTKAEIAVYPITPDEFLRLQHGDISYEDFAPKSNAVHTLRPDMTVPENSINNVELDLAQPARKPLAPGYYFLSLTAEPFQHSSRYLQGATIIIASDNLTIKTTASEAMAWLTDLSTGAPVPNVRVNFYSEAGAKVGSATTDKDGIAFVSDILDPAYARTDDKNRVAFTSRYWGDGVSLGNFGIYQDYMYSGQVTSPPFVYVYTERPIYRPNQDVFFKGIVRKNDDLHYSLPSEKSVFVTISFQGQTVYEKELLLNEFGTFSDSFHLGDDVSLGSYDIMVRFEKSSDTSYGWHSFRVAEYHKPEYEVTLTPNVTDVLAGDKFNFALDAEYYSGGALPGANVNWFVNASNATFAPASPYQSFSFYDWEADVYGGNSFSASRTLDEGQSVTDANGHLELSQSTEPGTFPNGSIVTLSANVLDVAGNLVGGTAAVHVHPSLIYAGIRTQSYICVAGESQTFDLVVLDWDSNPIAGQSVKVDIVRREWYSVQQKDEQGTLRWVTTVKEIPVASGLSAVTGEDGLATVSFTPPAGGVYKAIVRVQDKYGNRQQSSRFLWVSSKNYIPWQQSNDRSFNLVSDKDSYSPGDTAKLLIAQPFEGEHYALVTYERGHIYQHKVIKLEGNSTIYELPITKDMAPVSYVSVTVIQGAGEDSVPDFKVGVTRLNVDLEQQQLNVSIEADRSSAGPNDEVKYTVKVTDFAGKPVQAEVSLALVDKAVLALAPSNSEPLLDAFYPIRSLGVWTSLGIVLSADDFNANYRKSIANGYASGSGGGGKGIGDEGVIAVRQNFRDTAFYEAQVQTDKNGEATITVTLPENLTTWRMTARAITKDSLVGETTHELVSTKPLLVDMQTPRFFVTEDTARVGATVHNNTENPLTVKVTLEAKGVELTSKNEQTVEVEAHHQAYVTWDVSVGFGVERVDFTVTAAGGGYEDASVPAIATLPGGGIPVYSFHVTETVGTSGVLRGADSVTESLQMPATIPYKSVSVNVELSPSLAASMTSGLKYLKDFEYLCMEQTVSRFMPNVITARALELAGQPSTQLRSDVDKQVGPALQRIYSKQLADGGWSWWDRDESDLQVTAYVLLGLLEAREAGYIVSPSVIKSAIKYLRSNLPKLDSNAATWDFNRQAFAVYVLARAGQFASSTTATSLYENRARMSLFGKAYLAQAFFLENPEQWSSRSASSRVDTLMSDLSSTAVLSAAGAHWEEESTDYLNWNTDLRTTAIVLDTFVRIDPESTLTVDAVRWLMAHRRPNGWGSTQETVWTLIALTNWLTASREFESNFSYAAGLNGTSLQQGQVTPANLTTPVNVTISNAQLAQQVNYLVIARGAGVGNLYYTTYLNAELPVESVESLDRGIIVSRQYFTLDDSKNPITEIQRGELVRVRVTIVAPSALHYVVVNDPLPAGLEGVDASLLTDVQVPSKYKVTDFARRGWGWWYFTHIELRDEKVVLSANYLPAGTYVFTYLARASTIGTFKVIPTTAYEFYFPDVYGRGDGSVFEVKP